MTCMYWHNLVRSVNLHLHGLNIILYSTFTILTINTIFDTQGRTVIQMVWGHQHRLPLPYQIEKAWLFLDFRKILLKFLTKFNSNFILKYFRKL